MIRIIFVSTNNNNINDKNEFQNKVADLLSPFKDKLEFGGYIMIDAKYRPNGEPSWQYISLDDSIIDKIHWYFISNKIDGYDVKISYKNKHMVNEEMVLY